MTYRELAAFCARKRAAEYASYGELISAVKTVRNHGIDRETSPVVAIGLAYLMGVVDGKRAVRARRKPVNLHLDKPFKYVDMPASKTTP